MRPTNERSILSTSTWSCLRCPSPAWPAPKSSSAVRTPIERRPTSTSTVRSTSAMTMSSETSISRCSARRSWWRSSRSTSDGRPRSSRSAGPRLMATLMSWPRSRSAHTSSQRAVEDERGQRPRQAALLDQREEVAGAEQAALGVLPAHERLDAAHRAGPQLGLRLVVQDELAGLERGAELADEREPLAAVVVAADHVDLVAGAHALGLVHRDVRALQQPHGVAGVRGEQRDADAGVDVDADAADGEGMLERGAQPQPGGARRRLVAGLEDDRELVAAEPGERVVVAQELLQARADLAQHLVAGVVAERVVELLEAVEVDQEQRQLGRRPRTRSRSSSAACRRGGGGCRGR